MGVFRCPNCDMTLASSALLQKHTAKFCIGQHAAKDVMERMRNYKHHQRAVQKTVGTEAAHIALRPSQARKTNSEPTDHKSRNHFTEEQSLQVRELAKYHRKQATELEKERKHLEAQKKDIDLRLKELSSHTKSVSQLEKMLFDLQVQEERNTFLLEGLAEQLHQVHIGAEKDKQQSRHGDSLLYLQRKKEQGLIPSHVYVPVYGGGQLSAEISALRLSYLQGGGCDHLILGQLQQLLNEAVHLETSEGRQHRPQYRDKGRRDTMRDLIAAEVENQRLEQEIKRAKLRMLRGSRWSQQAHYTNTSHFPAEPNEWERKAMQTELELMRKDTEINSLKRQMKITTSAPSLSALPPLVKNQEDVRSHTSVISKPVGVSYGLGRAPYDPVAGFVVFYDFLLGLPPSYHQCRLVAQLYNGDQEIGSASPLPVICCEPHSLEPEKGNMASLAARQAVPRVLPSPAISLILELQASGGFDPYGQEVTHMVPRGWVKVVVFDSHDHMIGGKWKIPVRRPPIRPSMTNDKLNAVPQLGNAELYLRIVNARETDLQSSIPISHNNKKLYKYPPPVTARSIFAAGDLPKSNGSSRFLKPNIHMRASSESVLSRSPAGTSVDQE